MSAPTDDRGALPAAIPLLSPGFWNDLRVELDQLARMRAHGYLAIRFEVVDGQVREYSIKRKRDRLEKQHRMQR